MSYAAALNSRENVGVKAYDPIARWIGGAILAALGFFAVRLWDDHDATTRHTQVIATLQTQRSEDLDNDRRWKDQVTIQLNTIQTLLMRQVGTRKEP